ncbi:hypothetical protein THRCLA_01517, partial [Thraustotheca clavata]
EEYKIGDLVEVETRTWPGINKIGGAARVTNVYKEGQDTFVDVRYFLGGSEKRVDIEYVQPSDIHQKRARQRYSRVFFHHEFADEYTKNKRKIENHEEIPVKTKAKRVKKMNEHATTSVENENAIESSDSEDEPLTLRLAKHKQHKFMLQDNFFITDNATKSQEDDSGQLNMPQMTTTKSYQDESFDFGYGQLDQESPKALNSPLLENLLPQSPLINSPLTTSPMQSPERYSEPRKKRKKPRYVGGYLISEEDNFIQPEDNAMDLPDDVQNDTGFRLGKSAKDLLHQYKVHTEQFKLVLARFASEKNTLNMAMAPLELYNKIIELEKMHTLSIVREEDILDAILRKLDAKGRSINPVENLQHDQRKEQVNDFATWLRGIRDSTVKRLDRQGIPVPSIPNPKAKVDSSSSSEDDDYEIPLTFEPKRTTYSRPDKPLKTKPKSTMRAIQPTIVKSKKAVQQRIQWDEIYHDPEQFEPSTSYWSFSDNEISDDDILEPILPKEFIPRILNTRTIPKELLKSPQWDWKALIKPKKASRSVVRIPAPIVPIITERASAPAKSMKQKSKSKSIFEAVWRHRQQQHCSIAPGIPRKTKKNLGHPMAREEPVQIEKEPANTSCVLDYVAEFMSVPLSYTNEDIKVYQHLFDSVEEVESIWLHEDAPVDITITKVFRSLRHLLCDIQEAEALWIEKQTKSLSSSSPENSEYEQQLQHLCKNYKSTLFQFQVYYSKFAHQVKYRDLFHRELQKTILLLPNITSLLASTPAYYFYLELTENPSTMLLSVVVWTLAYAIKWQPEKSVLQTSLLFLFDLHQRVPYLLSSDGANDYIALWILLMTVKEAEFWAFITDNLASIRKIVIATFPSESSETIDMLLRELIWETILPISPLYSQLYPAIENVQTWALVGYLLSSMESLPFSPRYDATKSIYPLDKVENYRQRVLQRILILSSLWVPNHLPIVSIIMSMVQLPSSHLGQCACVASQVHSCDNHENGECPFPRFLLDMISTICTSAELLADIDHCSSLELMGRVIAMQLTKYKKPPLRNRFRHNILKVLKPAVTSTPTATKWNWSSITTGQPATTQPVVESIASTKVVALLKAKPISSWLNERTIAQTHCTVLLSMILTGLSSQDHKSMRRDVIHYAKEIIRLCQNQLENDSLAIHALWTLTKGVLTTTEQILPPILQHLHELLTAMVRRLAEVLAMPKAKLDSRLVSPQTILKANIDFALCCIYDLIVCMKSIKLQPSSVDDAVAALLAMYNQGIEAVLSACQAHQLSEAVLRQTLNLIHLVLPPATPVPPPSSFDEFDDPEEMAIFAALDEEAFLGNNQEPVILVTFDQIISNHVGDHIFKQLRIPLQKLVLQFPYPKNTSLVKKAIAALAGVFTFVPTASWDLLIASSNSANLRLLFPRTFRQALAFAPQKAAFVSSFITSHHQVLLEIWFLTFVEPWTEAPNLQEITIALSPHAPLLENINTKSSIDQVINQLAINMNKLYVGQPQVFRSTIVDAQKGLLTSILDGASASLLDLCVDRPEWALLQAFQASIFPYSVYDNRLLNSLSRNSTQRVVHFLQRIYNLIVKVFDACGHMARGSNLLFHVWLRELFPCAIYAQYSAAAKSLLEERSAYSMFREKAGPPTLWFASKLEKQWTQIIDGIRGFLAVQYYPTLLKWFAETAIVYQLFNSGFDSSPLRTLLYNLMDPEGPLGLSSYYPMDSDAAPTIKREAFYVACGLFHQSSDNEASMLQLRQFILESFMNQFANRRLEISDSITEEWVPMLGLLWACSNHASATLGCGSPNLNVVTLFEPSLLLCIRNLVYDLEWPELPVYSPLTCVLHCQLLGFAQGCIPLAAQAKGLQICLTLILWRCFYLRSKLLPTTYTLASDATNQFLTIKAQVEAHFKITISKPTLTIQPSAGFGINSFRAQGDLTAAVDSFERIAKLEQSLEMARLRYQSQAGRLKVLEEENNKLHEEVAAAREERETLMKNRQVNVLIETLKEERAQRLVDLELAHLREREMKALASEASVATKGALLAQDEASHSRAEVAGLRATVRCSSKLLQVTEKDYLNIHKELENTQQQLLTTRQ